MRCDKGWCVPGSKTLGELDDVAAVGTSNCKPYLPTPYAEGAGIAPAPTVAVGHPLHAVGEILSTKKTRLPCVPPPPSRPAAAPLGFLLPYPLITPPHSLSSFRVAFSPSRCAPRSSSIRTSPDSRSCTSPPLCPLLPIRVVVRILLWG